jgi:hypothetical protein
MHWQEMADEARMTGKSCLSLLPVVYFRMVEHQKDLDDECGQFVLQLGEKRDELDLSLALLGSSVDITRTSI